MTLNERPIEKWVLKLEKAIGNIVDGRGNQ